jgi:hypothetical protein
MSVRKHARERGTKTRGRGDLNTVHALQGLSSDIPLHIAWQSKHCPEDRELAGCSKSMYYLPNYVASYDRRVILTVMP